jgi:ATP-dependent DNA helicase 2 subunit 2
VTLILIYFRLEQKSIITFCIDISPTMGAKRKIVEQVNTTSSNQHTESSTRERVTTDLEWVNEFVAKKIQAYVLCGLKTAKIHILLFGSPRTNNILLQKTSIDEGYQGIDEIFLPGTPTISTLEMLRRLRAAKEEEKPYPADPLDALIAAITTLRDKDVSNLSAGYRKTIYLITDGKSSMNTNDKELIQKSLIEDNITLKLV